MVAIPHVDDFNASWSNRNDGEVLVTWGALRLTLSAAMAKLIHDKFGRALTVPARAAEMAARPVTPEPERIADAEPSISEPLDQRRRRLGSHFPFRVKRLQAVRRAIDEAGPMADVVSVCGILFTMEEAQIIERGLRVDTDGPR